jgi:hypothetical protein
VPIGRLHGNNSQIPARLSAKAQDWHPPLLAAAPPLLIQPIAAACPQSVPYALVVGEADPRRDFLRDMPDVFPAVPLVRDIGQGVDVAISP